MNSNNLKKVFLKGNEAVAMAAIEAGCRCYFGYPITPQSDIPEYLSRELPKVGGTFIQAESEIASINMVVSICLKLTNCTSLAIKTPNNRSAIRNSKANFLKLDLVNTKFSQFNAH